MRKNFGLALADFRDDFCKAVLEIRTKPFGIIEMTYAELTLDEEDLQYFKNKYVPPFRELVELELQESLEKTKELKEQLEKIK